MLRNQTKERYSTMFRIIGLASILLASFSVSGFCGALSGFTPESTFTNASVSSGPGFPGGFEMLLRTMGSLLLVAGMVVGVVFLLRRYVFNRNGSGAADGAVKVLSSTFLGPKKSIHLVKVLNRVLVLGMSESGMQTLSEFNADEVEGLLVKKNQDLKDQPFSKLLQSLIGHVKG